MIIKINILNSKLYDIETDIADDETIMDFMNKHDILTYVPNKFKCVIYNKSQIDNNLLIKNYIINNQINIWFKLRWFLHI